MKPIDWHNGFTNKLKDILNDKTHYMIINNQLHEVYYTKEIYLHGYCSLIIPSRGIFSKFKRLLSILSLTKNNKKANIVDLTK